MKSENSSRKSKIGDRKCYLAVLVNPRRPVSYTNPSVMNLNSMNHSSINNPNRPFIPPPANDTSHQNPSLPMMGLNFGNGYPPNHNGKIPLNPAFQKNIPPHNPLNNFLTPREQNNRAISPVMMNPGSNTIPNPHIPSLDRKIPTPGLPSFPQQPNIKPPQQGKSLLDTLSNILKSSKPEENSNNNREEYEDQQFWSGFFTRSKKNRVGVDALHVSGEEIQIIEFNLNISFRICFDEILKKKHCSLVLFVPSNETQINIFQEYILYFKEKARAGVIPLEKHTLYVLPPCEESKRYHHLRENQMLGVFVKAADDRQGANEIVPNLKETNKLVEKPDKNANHSELNDLKPLLENEEFMNILNNIKY